MILLVPILIPFGKVKLGINNQLLVIVFSISLKKTPCETIWTRTQHNYSRTNKAKRFAKQQRSKVNVRLFVFICGERV